jgi:hypothetical protein
LSGKGCANNKKDAKQDAAKALLLTMDSAVESILAPAKAAVVQDPTPLLEIDPDPEGNPVGDLNDMALKLKRLPPEYEVCLPVAGFIVRLEVGLYLNGPHKRFTS